VISFTSRLLFPPPHWLYSPSWALAAYQSPDLSQLVGLLGRVISPFARPLPKHRTAQTQNKHIYYILNIHAQNGIRTRNHGLRAIETVHASDRSATATGSRSLYNHKYKSVSRTGGLAPRILKTGGDACPYCFTR
jgi:hypothetical protein